MKTRNKAILVAAVMMLVYSFTLTGCGRNNVNSATDKNSQDQNGTNNTGSNVGNDLGNAVEDVGDAVGDLGNAAGDMLGANFNGFSLNSNEIVVLNMNVAEYRNLAKIIATYFILFQL